jgi:hypothetical protein
MHYDLRFDEKLYTKAKTKCLELSDFTGPF